VANFLLDHNVAAQVADRLNVRGHTAMTVGALGLAMARDNQLLLRAAQDHRIFITHNWKDFRLLHDAWREWSAAWGVTGTHAGILVIPTRPVWDPPRAADEIDQFVTAIQNASRSLANHLYRWEPTRNWVSY
jgi:hypothetical protein